MVTVSVSVCMKLASQFVDVKIQSSFLVQYEDAKMTHPIDHNVQILEQC